MSGTSNAIITANQMYWLSGNYRVNPATQITFEWMRIWSEYDLANPDDCADAGITDPTKYIDYNNGVVDRYTLGFLFTFN